jgi:NADH:ubiquinone oxidoreductase subunit 3 (subunit A)
LNYSRAKAGRYRCVYCWASGNGVLDIIKNISKGQLINYAKRKLYGVIITTYVYTILPATLVFTNATKFVGAAKTIHSTSAYRFECLEDSTNLASLPLNLALFGQLMNYFVFQIQHSHLFILHFI